MKKSSLILAAIALVAGAAQSQDMAAARAAYQQQQALAEVPRLVQQFDVLVQNQDNIVARLQRLEQPAGPDANLQAEIATLRAEVADLREAVLLDRFKSLRVGDDRAVAGVSYVPDRAEDGLVALLRVELDQRVVAVGEGQDLTGLQTLGHTVEPEHFVSRVEMYVEGGGIGAGRIYTEI